LPDSSTLLIVEKEDIIFLSGLEHFGHSGIFVVFILRDRKLKIVLQCSQRNSYIGIRFPPQKLLDAGALKNNQK
jgi:hypothetical protein